MNRTLTLFFTLACVCSPVVDPPVKVRDLSAYAQTNTSSPQPNQISAEVIKSKAEKITVGVFPKISQDNYKASGILIDKQEKKQGQQVVYLYLVLTNNHVLEGLQKRVDGGYQVQTYDGQIHDAFPYPQVNFSGNDLGLLWFYSTNNYEKAQLGKSKSLKQNGQVFVAGFPCEDANSCQSEFTFTSGKVFTELISKNKHLDAGYQIGFTNDTKDGMSGSPVLNEKGLLVGVNGRGKNQDLGLRSGDPSVPDINPYAYMDGTEPPPETIERLKEFAWAISIETYIKYQPKKPFDLFVNTLQILPIKDSNLDAVSQPNSDTKSSSTSGATKSNESRGNNKTYILVGVVFFVIGSIAGGSIYYLSIRFKRSQTTTGKPDIPDPTKPASLPPATTPQLIGELRINQSKRIVILLVAGNRHIIYGKQVRYDFIISGNPMIIVRSHIPESEMIVPISDCENYKLHHMRTIPNHHGDEEEYYNLTSAAVAAEQSSSIVLSFASKSHTELQS